MSALTLAAALALAAPAEAPRPVVTGVVLKLPPGEDAAVLEGLVAARSGEPLSARALRRTATLLYQLGRFSDVVIRAVPSGPGGVLLVVECLPKRLVKSLGIRITSSPQALDEDVLRGVLGFAPGDEFWQGRLDVGLERIRSTYERRGHRRARVAARATGETQVDVAVEVDEGPPTRVASVDLGPRLGAEAARLREGLRTRPGEVLSRDTLENDVRQLRLRLRREGWLRSRVAEPVLEVEHDDVRIRIDVDPGPRYEFRFTGSDHFSAKELREQLGIDLDQPLDQSALDASAGRLRAFYQERGWATARVDVRELASGGRALLLYAIDEGRRYRVERVRFSGNQARGAAWLREAMGEAIEAQETADAGGGEGERLARASGTANPPRGRPPAEPGQAWYEPVFRQVADGIVDRYRADGFLEAHHEGTRVVLDARSGTADVEIRIREGPRTVVDSVAFEGNAAIPLPQLLEASRLAPGDPLSFAAVEQTRAALLALYGRRGFLYARVQDAEDFTPDRTAAALRFKIEEGPQVKVASVVIEGNKRTREDVVRSTVGVKPGDVYDPAAVSRAQTSLLRLGVFRSAGLRLNDPEVPESQKDLTVELSERPWRTLAPGLGVSTADGVRAFVEFSQPNLLGQALEFAVRVKVNYPFNFLNQRPDIEQKAPADRFEGYANVGLHQPRLYFIPLPLGVHLDAIGEQAHRKAYDMWRVSTVLGLDAAVLARTAASLQFELEVNNIKKTDSVNSTLTQLDVSRLQFPEGVTTLISIRPALAYDLRDNSAHPRSGWYFSAGADYAHSLGYRPPGEDQQFMLGGLLPGSEVYTNMLKLQGVATRYQPLGRSVVVALSLRAGRVLPLDPSSQTIGPKRFFLGGASTMRGAAEDEMIAEDLRPLYLEQARTCSNSLSGLGCTSVGRSVAAGNPPISEGGEAFLLGKLEARVVLRGSIEAGFFVDAGNLWLNPTELTLSSMHFHVGLGLRIVTPVGPAVLDLGVNTAPDRRLAERVYAPHFAIGLF